MKQIYIVEDDASIREIEVYALKNSGYSVFAFESAKPFYKAFEQNTPDLIILDLMLPGDNGLKILSHIRNVPGGKTLPVILVTAKTLEMDKVKGLDSGADDYITKPFGIMEFIARVKAVLRRSNLSTSDETLKIDTLLLDDRRHTVTVDNVPCKLTYKEYELLKYLMQNVNHVLTRDQIMDTVWGYAYEGESRTVDVHIKTLRTKLKTSGDMIKTIRNVGYVIEPLSNES